MTDRERDWRRLPDGAFYEEKNKDPHGITEGDKTLVPRILANGEQVLLVYQVIGGKSIEIERFTFPSSDYALCYLTPEENSPEEQPTDLPPIRAGTFFFWYTLSFQAYENGSGQVYMTLADLAGSTGYTVRTTLRHLKLLREKGYIDFQATGGKDDPYIFTVKKRHQFAFEGREDD